MTITQLDKQYIAPTYNRFPVELVSGKGSVVTDTEGKEYIDLGTGIAVNTFGVADEQWMEAVTSQLGAIAHTSNLYYSSPNTRLAEMLCEKTGMDKVFFCNSGAEANECAIKAARKYSHDKYGSGRSTIITLKNSFHGRTVTTLAATGQEVFHKDFRPLTPGFVHADPNMDSVNELLKGDSVAAVMFETVQGEGGVCPLDGEFLRQLQETALQKDILLIADEVQCGNGRTGKLYGYMHFNIHPDIVTTAKGLAGGLPLGVAMLSKKVSGVFKPGDHGSTFGGNPVCCAGAVNILSRLNDQVLEGVRRRSQLIFDRLSGAKGIKSVTGLGLMVGLETEKPASQAANELLQQGVLVLTAKTKVRLLPALNIPIPLLETALDKIMEVCAK